MDIAIIGGGAAGMATAYYLSKNGHHVTVYEKQPILGGNIRTLNKNVHVSQLDPNLTLEAGVIEFPDVFHNFMGLMKELDVALEPVEMGSAILLKNGRHVLSPTMIKRNIKGVRQVPEYLRLINVYASAAGLWLKTQLPKYGYAKHLNCSTKLHDKPLSQYVGQNNDGNNWFKSLVMYSYSIPFRNIGQVPAELAVSAMRDYVWADWVRIKGGVYSYIEKILMHLNGEVVLNAEIESITRKKNVVKLVLADKSEHLFDKVVFAMPPDQVLKLLSDPSPEEVKRFSAWQKNRATTLIHTDISMYARYGVKQTSEFDFFETDNAWGYNCSLNQLCGLKSSTHYNLAFNLESLIDKKLIVHSQEHNTPLYTVEAFHYRDEIIKMNGENNTYHAGAYLQDGLHEGAITSATQAAQLIGL